MTPEQAITVWIDRWRNLKAWRCSLDDIKAEVVPYKGTRNLGMCYTAQRRIVVKVDRYDPADALHTALHELAHAATPGDPGHGVQWQTVFGDAITEVTGVDVPTAGDNYRIVNTASKDAIRYWWHASGSSKLWRMAVDGRFA